MWDASFAPVPPGRQLGLFGVVKTAVRPPGLYLARGAVTDRIPKSSASRITRYEYKFNIWDRMEDPADTRPILIVPYMWIGDFVRGHTVVRVLKQRWPNRPVDLLVTPLCAPLVDYMPGVRSGILWDLPRSRLAVASNGRWRSSCGPTATAPRWCCPGPGNRRLRRRWPVSRNGWALSARPGSGCSTDGAGARRRCPA